MSQTGFSGFSFPTLANAFQTPGVGVEAMFEIQRKNIEAFVAAGKTISEGYQTAVRRQAEILKRSIEQTQELVNISVSSAPAEEKLAKQADVTKVAYQQAVSDARELRDIIANATSEAAEIANRRVVATLDEVKAAAQNTARKVA